MKTFPWRCVEGTCYGSAVQPHRLLCCMVNLQSNTTAAFRGDSIDLCPGRPTKRPGHSGAHRISKPLPVSVWDERKVHKVTYNTRKTKMCPFKVRGSNAHHSWAVTEKQRHINHGSADVHKGLSSTVLPSRLDQPECSLWGNAPAIRATFALWSLLSLTFFLSRIRVNNSSLANPGSLASSVPEQFIVN